MSWKFFARNGLVLAVAGALGCGGGGNTPTAVATATPAPVATPTPAPSATPSPTAFSCALAPMPECAAPEGPAGVYGCCRQRSDELGEFVELAIRDVQAARPELFNGDEILHVEDEDIVVQLVARRLEQRFGLCARPGSPIEDEVAVKNSNNFSEQFDIILSNHRVNVYGYASTCRPARF